MAAQKMAADKRDREQREAERQRKAASSQRRGVKAAQETRRLQQACIEVGVPPRRHEAVGRAAAARDDEAQ